MAEQEKVTVNGIECLKKYWYKFILQLIQKEFDIEDDVFLDALGEEDFQNFWDLLTCQEDLVNSTSFNSSEFDERLREIGRIIETSVENASGYEWFFNNKAICVDSNKVNGYASQLFDDLILPYLQLKHNDVIRITGSCEGLIHFFEYHLRRNDYSLQEKVSRITSVEVLTEDSWAMEWKEQNSFLIRCDLNAMIPITLKVKPVNGEFVYKMMEITFPFFKKNDAVSISISFSEFNWTLSAINENNGLEFTSEINI